MRPLQAGERTGSGGKAHGVRQRQSGMEPGAEIAAECVTPAPTVSTGVIFKEGTV